LNRAPLALAALAAAGSAWAQGQPEQDQANYGRLAPHPVASLYARYGPIEQGALVEGRTAPGARLTLDGRQIPVAADGSFIIGIDRDAGPTLTLVRDGTTSRTWPVPRRAWPVQHVDIARQPDGATDDFLRRREPELARINAARARGSDSQGWRQVFAWPARGRISGRFGSQRIYRGAPGGYHSGVDVAPGAGAPVRAPADGLVVLAAPGFSLEGNLVILDHGMGLSSAFLHLSRIDVTEGQRVAQGELIGAVGATGRATGPHLHWSLTWNGARLDPQRVAGPMN
jgi:murein DD-endopeptidase MepM/ murein hydrolase activator NlpD